MAITDKHREKLIDLLKELLGGTHEG